MPIYEWRFVRHWEGAMAMELQRFCEMLERW
jgi:hypothetical protein